MDKARVYKTLVVVGAAVGLIVAARRMAPKLQAVDWEQRFEQMPDNAPPKWMFTNIRAIRANTDRILEVLTREGPEPVEPGSATT